MSKQQGKKGGNKQQPKKKPKVDDDEDEPQQSQGKGGKKAGTGTKVKVRHILCEKHSKIMEAQKKLQEGIPFATVCSCYQPLTLVGGWRNVRR